MGNAGHLLGLVVLMAFVAAAALPNVDVIELEGEYPGHLQDVWYDGGSSLYWAHTEYIVPDRRFIICIR